MRKRYTLTEAEARGREATLRLPPDERPAAARAFWHAVAAGRGLDPGSLVAEGTAFSGLPVGHGKWWCYPSALKCAQPPVAV